MLISFWANKLVFEVHLPKFSMLLFVAVVITVWHTCTCSLCHYLLQLNRNEKKEYMCILQNTSVCCARILMKVLSNLPLASTHATLYTHF